MGYIIETPGFIPYYSGYMNLKLLADLNGKIGEKEIRHSMECVGLDPDLKRHVVLHIEKGKIIMPEC